MITPEQITQSSRISFRQKYPRERLDRIQEFLKVWSEFDGMMSLSEFSTVRQHALAAATEALRITEHRTDQTSRENRERAETYFQQIAIALGMQSPQELQAMIGEATQLDPIAATINEDYDGNKV